MEMAKRSRVQPSRALRRTKEFFMLRPWLRAGLCACVVSLAGCGGDRRDSIITDTTTQMSEAASAVNNIQEKVKSYVAKREADVKEAEAAKDLEEAVADAKKLKDIAKAMQVLSSRVSALAAPTPEETKKFLDTNRDRINRSREDLITNHRAMRTAIDDAKKKYEGPLQPLAQALTDAEGEFAAITRRK
jgi:hypothetical protein